jgi:hypothetical protein
VEKLLKKGFSATAPINISTMVKHKNSKKKIIPIYYLLYLNRNLTQDDVNIVKLLIKYGKNDECIDYTCILTKLFNKCDDDDPYVLPIVHMMFKKISVSDKQCLLDCALLLVQPKFVALLLQYNLDVNSIVKNNKNINLRINDIILKLIIKYLTIETLNRCFRDPLLIACKAGCYITADRILNSDSSSINVLRNIYFSSGTTLLQIVLDVIDYCVISYGLKNKVTDNFYKTIKILINHGAIVDPSITNSNIKSYVIERKNTMAVALLEIVPRVLIDIIICY